METFGEYLRGQREKKGIRLEEIASITKIHLHSLQHLERGAWEDLPPEPFIRGFIIAYAKYVGLEPKDVMERYALEHGKSNPQGFDLGVVSSTVPDGPALVPPTSHRAEQSPDELVNTSRTFPIRKTIFAVIGVFFLITIGVLVSLGKEKTEPTAKVEVKEQAPVAVPSVTTAEAPPAPSADRAVSSNAQTPVAAPKEVAKPTPSEFAHEIVFETKERSWAKIVIDDKPPVEFYSTPGKKITYQAKNKLKLVLGNSVGANVVHNGQVVEGKKVMGTIRFYIYPEGARFAQEVTKRKEASEAATNEPSTDSGESQPSEKQD